MTELRFLLLGLHLLAVLRLVYSLVELSQNTLFAEPIQNPTTFLHILVQGERLGHCGGEVTEEAQVIEVRVERLLV